MASDALPTGRKGFYENTVAAGRRVRGYVPARLPPDPPVELGPVIGALDRANQALGRLDGLTRVLPDVQLFLYMYVRKEAVLSSQIEGTQSSLSDLLLYEVAGAPGAPMDDVQEVSNYVAALNHGLERMRSGFPLSLRLICEMHDVLLSAARGDAADRGAFRRSQNWVGGTGPDTAIYVPPPPQWVMPGMGDLETFVHAENRELPYLVKVALVHVQFETVHPFLDGNGRLGRLLITLLLCERGILSEPLLYLSLFLKTHRDRYYELLQRVREDGDWEAWLAFFLEGVIETAEQAAETAQRVLQLFEADRRNLDGLGGTASSTLRVHELLQRRPLVTIPQAERQLTLSQPTIAKAMGNLADLGIVEEVTGRQRGRVFVYRRFLEILSEGTEPIGAGSTGT